MFMRRIRSPKRIIKSTSSIKTKEGEIPFTLARSSGRRTLMVSINESAEVNVSSPFALSDREIYRFMNEKPSWIIAKIEDAKRHRDIIKEKEFNDGHEFLFLGEKYNIRVHEADIKRGRIDFDPLAGWAVVIPQGLSSEDRQAQVKQKMVQWYRAQAKEVLGGRIFHYSRLMGVQPRKIDVRTQKRLWGCCDYRTQTIHLNWQIILSPLKVIDYVVVHELCHLMVPSHSKRFWNKVKKVIPDFVVYRRWLKINHLDMVLP
jgi:predicted metal-dependent hydrolase